MAKDIFDRIKLDVFDKIELSTEEKVIYSGEISDLIREELRTEIRKLPVGQIVSDVAKKWTEKQDRTAGSLKESVSAELDKTKKAIETQIGDFKSRFNSFADTIKDKHTDLRNEFYAATDQKLYLGGPSAIRFQEENGSDLGYPNVIKFANGSVTVNSDGSYSIASGGSTTVPGGSDTQVQYNDGGSFNGSALLTFNETTGRVTNTGGVTVTNEASSSTAGTASKIITGSPITKGLQVMGSSGTVSAVSPDTISGILVWLESDYNTFQDTGRTTLATANNDPIASWGNRAATALYATQSTSGSRPLLKTNVLNGLPGILGDDVDDYLDLGNLSSYFTGSEGSLYVVYNGNGDTEYGVLDANPSNDARWQFSGIGLPGVFRNNRFSGSYNNSNTGTHVVGIRSGGNYSLSYDGTALINGATDWAAPTINTLFVESGNRFLGGYIFAVLYFTRALTAAEDAQVLLYLKSKYNLSYSVTSTVDQSSNFIEFINGASTLLSYVDGNGAFIASGVNAMIQNSTSKGVLISGGASQSANFLEVQKAGSVVLSVNSSGYVVGGPNLVLRPNAGSDQYAVIFQNDVGGEIFRGDRQVGFSLSQDLLWSDSVTKNIGQAQNKRPDNAYIKTSLQINTTSSGNQSNTAFFSCATSNAYKTAVLRGTTSQSAVLLQLQGESSVQSREQADIDTAWVASTDASRKARLVLRAWDTAAREGIRVEGTGSAAALGFFGASAVAQQSGTGETTGFTAGTGTAVKDDSTFTGNIGSTAYRINDIVKALKNLGLLAQ